MKVLAVESSCDDTSVSIVDSNKRVLANVVISQNIEHQAYGGVVPEIAARTHLSNLKLAVDSALQQSNCTLREVDFIAATTGPGLIGGVLVGSVFAKTVACILGKKFIPINHLEGHILAIRLAKEINFPYVTLLASGGHCQFILVSAVGKYKILGKTLDDAAGEAFDKTARLLGLGYPGGPVVEKLAKKGDKFKYKFPLPMINRPGCDLSFSGLKTAVRVLISSLSNPNEQEIADICASFQFTVAEILKERSKNAILLVEKYLASEIAYNSDISSSFSKNFVLTGGVASNLYIRESLSKELFLQGYRFEAPPLSLCTDNAAMIAWAAIERIQNNKVSDLSFVRAKWNLEEGSTIQ